MSLSIQSVTQTIIQYVAQTAAQTVVQTSIQIVFLCSNCLMDAWYILHNISNYFSQQSTTKNQQCQWEHPQDHFQTKCRCLHATSELSFPNARVSQTMA